MFTAKAARRMTRRRTMPTLPEKSYNIFQLENNLRISITSVLTLEYLTRVALLPSLLTTLLGGSRASVRKYPKPMKHMKAI